LLAAAQAPGDVLVGDLHFAGSIMLGDLHFAGSMQHDFSKMPISRPFTGRSS
jgi:hypothetical protein